MFSSRRSLSLPILSIVDSASWQIAESTQISLTRPEANRWLHTPGTRRHLASPYRKFAHRGSSVKQGFMRHQWHRFPAACDRAMADEAGLPPFYAILSHAATRQCEKFEWSQRRSVEKGQPTSVPPVLPHTLHKLLPSSLPAPCHSSLLSDSSSTSENFCFAFSNSQSRCCSLAKNSRRPTANLEPFVELQAIARMRRCLVAFAARWWIPLRQQPCTR